MNESLKGDRLGKVWFTEQPTLRLRHCARHSSYLSPSCLSLHKILVHPGGALKDHTTVLHDDNYASRWQWPSDLW